MSTFYFSYPQAPKHSDYYHEFKKIADPKSFETVIPIEPPKAYIPSYTYHTIDSVTGLAK